ncbi:homeobox protein NANOG [Denticeps clupeoides]|uniref:homeobox protein NANOG n=1 Tax=Denticeps clupeoides TaxID=299321 RepID=UPI0010A4FC1B|nr:homeobox protein Hox-D3-like [Denticeps clupeoides]
MADWKLPVSYNYNPSYHAYAYGLMYPPGSEQNRPGLNWAEAAYSHQVVAGGFYSTQAAHQSPPQSPEAAAPSGGAHYPAPVLYFPDSAAQDARSLLSQTRSPYRQLAKESERASSDNPSDSEAHTPDSWSSGSSSEGSVRQADPTNWAKEGPGGKVSGGDCPTEHDLSRSLAPLEEEPSGLDAGDENVAAASATSSPPGQAGLPRKAKTRTAFSEGQMTALTHRFSVQRYLTPAEMKTLAGITGLTYKQVKTWFQNRRMKLKRHQKDNTWVSERFPNSGYSTVPTPHSQFQLQEPCVNPQFRDAVFKKGPPSQTPPFYPAYGRPPSPSGRLQGNWPLPPAITQYEYPHQGVYVPPNGNSSVNSDDESLAEGAGTPARMSAVHAATEWPL